MSKYNIMKMCFTTFVWGAYQDYIPAYIYSILESFPQHYVKIFLHETLTEKTKNCLSLIKSNNFEVIENFDELDVCDLPHKAAIRFLLPEHYFKDFDYIYFGDVDFIIYNQFEDNFYDQYIAHCQTTKLPFSNEYNYDYGKYRMTGLHFVIKDQYFEKMNNEIESMKLENEFKKQCVHTPLWPSYDEEMLFYMCNRVFDLRPLINYRRPFHGLHFGTFRIIGFGDSFCTQYSHETDGRNNIKQWIKDKKKIKQIMDSTTFKEFEKNMCKEVSETILKTKSYINSKLF